MNARKQNESSLRERLRRAWRFANEDIWDIELGSLSSLHSLGVRSLRVVYLVFKGFREDECPLHASALTFNTLMAIVPILALSLSLARVFGGADLAEEKIQGAVSEWTQAFKTGTAGGATEAPASPPPAPDVMQVGSDPELSADELARQINEMVGNAFTAVENISFAALGSIGLVLLLWMVISVLGRVEASFNRVWGVSAGRSLWRKFTDYLSVLLILPFLVTAALSLPIADLVTGFMDETLAAGMRTILGSDALRVVTTVVLTSLTFAFVIMFMPNTRVSIRSGLAGGLVSALLFLAWLWICAAIQVGVARYGKIYGSFAVVPILLAWVYVSWEIVLFGAEVAFAVQNCATYRMEQGASRANLRARLLLALSVLTEAGRAMAANRGPFSPKPYAAERRIPVRFLNGVIDELVRANMLVAVADGEDAWVLLRTPSAISLTEVVDVVMNAGIPAEALGLGSVDRRIRDVVTAAGDNTRAALAGKTLQTLLAEA